MAKVTKGGAARVIAASYLVLKYRKEMQENYRKGDWAEAGKDTFFFSLAVLPVVAPTFVFGTLAPVWVAGAGVVITTAAIVNLTGIGTTQDVIDILLDPPTPTEWYDVVAPEVKKKAGELQTMSEEFQIGAVAWVDRRLMEGQHYLEREYQEKKELVETGWELLNRYGRWYNPVLPF